MDLSRLSAHNAAGLARWLRLRRLGVKGDLFYLGPRSDIRLDSNSDVTIEGGTQILADFTGSFFGLVKIGGGTFINRGGYIAVHESVTIGHGCLFGEYTSIHDGDHGFGSAFRRDLPYADRGFLTKPITIGDFVWLGSHCTVTRGVTIGESSVVAAGAVVTRDVPPRTLVAGIPAKPIRSWENSD